MTEVDIVTWRCGGPPSTGQYQRYPGRFVANLKRYYPELVSDKTLHMFAGSIGGTKALPGTTTDIREEAEPDVVAPYDNLPFEDSTFTGVLADPPYANHWANEWHTELPKPGRILHEASRVTQSGGLVAILHLIVVPAYKTAHVERVGIHPVLVGPNNAIRALNVFRVQ